MKTVTLAALAGLLISTGHVAASEPENYIKYRQAVMMAIGGHMGATAHIVRGKVDEPDALAMHARALASLSADLVRLFPEGSDFGETEAKAEIWENPEGFAKAAAAARDATAAFAAAAEAGDPAAIAAARQDVGSACKGCHEDFRVKKD